MKRMLLLALLLTVCPVQAKRSRTKNVEQRIKEEVAFYLLDNLMRLNNEQQTELWNLLDTWKLFDRQRSFMPW